jgi:hypothetical protein
MYKLNLFPSFIELAWLLLLLAARKGWQRQESSAVCHAEIKLKLATLSLVPFCVCDIAVVE